MDAMFGAESKPLPGEAYAKKILGGIPCPCPCPPPRPCPCPLQPFQFLALTDYTPHPQKVILDSDNGV